MSPTTQVLLSGALTFGVPMLLAFRELRVLRRPGRGKGRGSDRGGDPAPSPPPPSPVSHGSPRPLPECLIIAARGLPQRKARVPELV